MASQRVDPSEILILGVGRAGCGDEGVGPRAVELVRTRVPPEVRMLAIDSIEPMTLVELDEASHILVLDSIDVGRTPGTIVWFDADDLSPCASRSVFRFGVADLLMLAGQTGNAPEEAGILGVQPASTEAGAPMCPQVRAALPRLVGRAARIVERWLDDSPSTFDRASAKDPCRDGVGLPL